MGGAVGPWGRQANHGGIWEEEKEEKTADTDCQYSGKNESQSPVTVGKGSCHQSSKYVAKTGVGVPHSHDEPALALAEPVCHHRDHPGPASGLHETSEHLDGDEVPDGVHPKRLGQAKHKGGEPREEHAGGEKEAKVNTFRHKAAGEHADGVRDQVGGVEQTQDRVGVLLLLLVQLGHPRPARLSCGAVQEPGTVLHNGEGLPRGVVSCVGDEGENENGETIEELFAGTATALRRLVEECHPGRHPLVVLKSQRVGQCWHDDGGDVGGGDDALARAGTGGVKHTAGSRWTDAPTHVRLLFHLPSRPCAKKNLNC